MSGTFVRLAVPNKFVKFRDPRLHRSPEIGPEVVGGGIFGRFSNIDDFRPKVDSDTMSGAFVEQTGVAVRIRGDESRSNCSRDIRLPLFVSSERRRRTPAYAGHRKRPKRHTGVFVKIKPMSFPFSYKD